MLAKFASPSAALWLCLLLCAIGHRAVMAVKLRSPPAPLVILGNFVESETKMLEAEGSGARHLHFKSGFAVATSGSFSPKRRLLHNGKVSIMRDIHLMRCLYFWADISLF